MSAHHQSEEQGSCVKLGLDGKRVVCRMRTKDHAAESSSESKHPDVSAGAEVDRSASGERRLCMTVHSLHSWIGGRYERVAEALR